MRAELRDAKIAAAKAENRVKVETTAKERRAARLAAKYAGWRVQAEHGSAKREARREVEALYRAKTGRPMSGRQFRNHRKTMNRLMRAGHLPADWQRAA